MQTNEDFMTLVAVILSEVVRINGGPFEIPESAVRDFDPFKTRVVITPDEERGVLIINSYSAEVIEGEVIGTAD